MASKLLYVSKKGGTISRFKGDSSYLFRVYSDHLSIYCHDIASAKAQLDRLERLKIRSCKISVIAMENERKALRKLVESAAAPFITKMLA